MAVSSRTTAIIIIDTTIDDDDLMATTLPHLVRRLETRPQSRLKIIALLLFLLSVVVLGDECVLPL
jgi:hypothetical protein